MGAPRRRVVRLAPDGRIGDQAPTRGVVLLWPYTQDRRSPLRLSLQRLLDPVNLVVAGATPDDVALALGLAGWRRPRVARPHCTWINGHLIEMDRDAILGDEGTRFHLRLWRIGRCTLGAAHHEIPGRRVRHVVTGWDDARARVAEDLARAGYAPLGPSPRIAPPDHRGLESDGRAWRLAAPAASYADRVVAAVTERGYGLATRGAG